MIEFITGKKASELLGVHQRTLYLWDKKKIIETIRTPGGKLLYNVKKYLEGIDKNKSNVTKMNVPDINEKIQSFKINYIYARVSSLGQKEYLERQKALLQKEYPDYTLITDIGSGMNLNRSGLRKIIDKSIEGKVNEVVIVHKDRLCRFGYDLIEDLIQKYSNGKIVVIGTTKEKEPKEELVDDVLQIMNIFVAKINGMKKYEKNNKN
jgi:putative resolvase